MIIFYNKKTGVILGTIEGRVHYQEHFVVSISRPDTLPTDVGRLIIGFEDTGEMEEVKDKTGKMIKRPIYREHNLHLWKDQVEFADPKNPKRPHDYKVRPDKKGKVVGFDKIK